MARPSKYKEEYAKIAEKLSEFGLIDKQLAELFEVSEVTINAWKKQYPDFLNALKRGKEISDNQVEMSLFQRATGYSHQEDKIFNQNGVPLIVPTTKHYPPDTIACIFWLKNRRAEQWREKPEGESTPPNITIEIVDPRADKADKPTV